MILSFDKFERYELPQVILCNPNSRATEVDGKITITDTVGVLSNPKRMNLKLNFNAPHELSFDYYRHKSTDPIKQSFYDSICDAIQTDRYIYLTDIGYFIISSVTDSDEDNIDKKSIACKSCEENELATAEGLHLKEGTYYLHTDNKDGLLDLFLPKTAGWTLGYIDPSLLTKPYYVEDTEVDNGYNFLYTTIQNMFECIVEPDIIKRTISVYSRVYYAEHHLTDIHIAKYNLLKHKTVEENDEDKYTALNVRGKDENLEIRAVNPTGKNVIYNFEPRYAWMSPALQVAVTKWQEKCDSVEDKYLTLQKGYYNDMQNIIFPLEKDIETLELQLKEKQQTRDLIVYGEYDKEQYETQQKALDAVNAEIKSLTTQINTSKQTLDTAKDNIKNNYLQPLTQINKDCALDTTAVDINGNTIFTVELLNELMTHIKTTNYIDEYMLVTESMTYPQRFEKAKELMDRAKSQLVKISSGQKTYSIDTRSFLFNKQFKHFSEQLCAGAIIYVETKNDIMEQLHLTGIDINFDEKSTNFTLGNKYDRSDLKALYDEALGQNSKSFSELKYIAGIIEEQQKQLDYQKNWVAELRTLTLDNVLTSEDQAIEINNRGLIGRKRQLNEDGSWKSDNNGNPLFYDEQVKLINDTIVFTKDNWKHAETAVGKIAVGYDSKGNVKYSYGINGRVLIGELILGNNLVLTGTGAGIKITDSNGNNVFFADENGNLVLSGTIYATSGKIGGWNITSNMLVSKKNGTDENNKVFLKCPSSWAGQDMSGGQGDVLIVCSNGKYPFKLLSDGSLTCTKATITGTINATYGSIGGWNINSSSIYNTTQTGYQVYLWNPAIASGDIITFTNGTTTPFRVDRNGVLYATGATVSGNITATNGEIGGWSITSYSITKNTDDFEVFLHAPTSISESGGDGDVLVVRNKQNNTYPFILKSSGKLTARNVDITGTITATSGTFSNCIINKTCTIKKVEADEGYIGNWKILNDWIKGNDVGYSKTTLLTAQYIVRQYTDGSGGGHVSWERIFDHIGIDTSDIRYKENIEKISDNYDAFFDLLNPVRYKYKDGNSGRYHTGFVAQEVVDSLEKSNLDTEQFAAVCLDKPANGDECWFLRRDEFVALNTWQIQRCKKRIASLENTVEELKTQIQTLTAG